MLGSMEVEELLIVWQLGTQYLNFDQNHSKKTLHSALFSGCRETVIFQAIVLFTWAYTSSLVSF